MKFFRNRIKVIYLLLVVLNITTVLQAQENVICKDKLLFKDTLIQKLLLTEFKRINKLSTDSTYILFNYNKGKNKLKLLIVNKEEFGEYLKFFHQHVEGLLIHKNVNMMIFGDIGDLFVNTNKKLKTNPYITYYDRKIYEKELLAKKQDLINFPNSKDPISYIFSFEENKLKFLKMDMVFVLDDERF